MYVYVCTYVCVYECMYYVYVCMYVNVCKMDVSVQIGAEIKQLFLQLI